MTIYDYITGTSFPITLEGVIEDIMDGLITIRDAKTGDKIPMPDKPEYIERDLRIFMFAGEELSEDEHTLYAYAEKR